MGLFRRFGGIMAGFALFVGFFVLGFAASNPALLFIALLCWWPILVGIIAWTARGLRDHYQLVPKGQERQAANGGQRVRARQAIPEDYN